MNTEKLEKLKKSLDNKFIPDNMKDKIRAEIKKLEADIKTDETITATEVKEEVKEIEKKVEKALEVAEEKEEQAEAKAEEKKAKKSRTKTPKPDEKPKSAKKSVFSIAKEIRKDGESWEEAKDRARKMMKSETTETKKKTKTETQKLLAMVRRNKEYKKLTGSSNLAKDATRRALPRGKRVSESGNVYYENRANRVDVGGFKNAYLAKGGEIEMENSNLYFVGRGRDVNGNKVIKISFPNQKPFSIQTLGNLPKTHRILREYDNDKDITPEEIATIEREVIAYIEEFGSKKQKESLRKYEGGGYANKGVYVETLDEEIDLTDDGKPRVLKTQEGGNKSFSQRREMHGASPEALAFDNGGKVGRYSILGEVDGEQPVLYATTDDKERIKPLVNMAEIDLYELTGKNHRIFVTDEVTDDEVYSYGNGGRTRERRYVNHSEDYEVRYSKDKPHRRGYGYAGGGVVLDNVKIEVYKSFHGLKAENYFDDVNGYDWNVVTMKRHTGELVSSARGGKANKSEGNVEFFTFDYNSPNIKLISSRPSRVTEKVIEIQHSQALQLFKEKMEQGNFAEGGTIIGTPETPLGRDLGIDYTGLVGETGGMSAGEMFANGGGIPNNYQDRYYADIWDIDWTQEQKNHFLQDHKNEIGFDEEFYGVSIREKTTKKIKSSKGQEVGFAYIDVDKLLKTKSSELPKYVKLSLQKHIREGQYAMGGSLGNHGLKQGDQIIKTMSGGVQKVKTKSGDIVYVNLANGYRGAEPPLPFAKGGYTNERRHVNKSQDYEVRYAKNKPNRTGYLGKRSFDDGGLIEEFNPKSFSLAEIDEKLRDNDIYIQWLAMGDFNTSADKRDLLWTNTSSSTKWNKVKDLRLTISDYGLLELSKGSENLYLNFVVYEKDGYDPMNIQIYTKDNHVGLKQFARQIVDKFEEGGFMTDPNFGDFQSEVYAEKGAKVDNKFNYMMLSRLQMDCDYYLGYGNRNEKVLWAGNVDDHIAEMKKLWNNLPKNGKPEWLTMEDILDYEKKMKSDNYSNGGVTKNYINRNQLNTITIKKGNQKLTYKVSDVYNGAYKLEEGGNLEKTAFYVSKRNVVKVQLKNGKDVKVANGYWIKKGAKPIHTSKYDDGGMTEKDNNLNYGIPKEDLENYEIEEVLKDIVDIDYDNSNLEKSKYIILAKPINNNYKNNWYEPKVFIVTEKGIYTISNAKKSKWEEIKKDIFDNELTFEKYGYFKIMLNGGKTTFKEKAKPIHTSKYEDGGQLEMKFLKGGKLESKIQKKVDEVNSLIEKAIDKDGDPIMVIDKSGTWEEPMQYKPIVYKNGRLYFEYYEPYSGKTQKEVVNKSNIEFDGYPMLLDIAKMYRSALKQKGVSFAGGGSTNKEIEINSEIEKIIEEIKSKGKYEKGKESVNAKGQKYRWDFYKLENPSSFLLKKIDSIQFKNYGQRTLSNSFDYRKLELKNNKNITIDRPTYKGQSSKFVTYRELVLLNAGGGYLKNGYFKNEIDNDYIEEINKYYNKWNSIKDEKDSENFKKTKPPMFGTYQETDILNQIKHFEKLDIPFQANEVSRNQFKKEVSKIIDNFMNKKSYKGGGSTKRGGAMQLAKQIRKEGESWQSALKRANEQMRNK